ncbi:Dolichyl-diphosphooligosaccharide--protein glycosyltransferase 48 kDa subunit [Ancistrocladus abbreviatus]
MANLIAILALIFFLTTKSLSFSPESPTNRRILVLLDDFAIKSSHYLYFKSLQSRGYELDFKLADDPKIALQRYGRYLYDGLILFSPTVDRFGGKINQADVLEFVDSGHDLIVAADVNASDLIREIATDCGVDFDDDSAAVVIDHTSYAVSNTEGDHTLIASDNFIQSDVILGSKKIEAPVLFQGIGHSLNPANNLVLKVLSASPSAYSANPKSEISNAPMLTGSAISLVSVVQARNNARILISGSLSMFSDRFFRSGVQTASSSIRHEKSGNEQFLTELSKWVFHERGHLKAVNVKHHKVGEAGEPSMYRISDDLEYSVEIYEWSGRSWEPYVASDVQVQFYMMSPYVLKTLSTNQKGLYHTSFKVPDVYGVFQFKVEYQQLGYTSLSLSKQMAGFFIFTLVHLYSK